MKQLLSPIMLVIAASHLLMPTDSKASSLTETIEIANQALVSCQKSQVQSIDDKQSDAKVIALKLTDACLDEYEALTKMTAKEKFDTSNERRMFRTDQNAKMLKIEASLPAVRKNRQVQP